MNSARHTFICTFSCILVLSVLSLCLYLVYSDADGLLRVASDPLYNIQFVGTVSQEAPV